MQPCEKYLVVFAVALFIGGGCSKIQTEVDVPESSTSRGESTQPDARPQPEGVEKPDKVRVLIQTSKGDIEAELWPDRAPSTVNNFLRYVDDSFFDGTIFHRVIDDFMIQGGGFTANMREKPTRDPINNEAQPDVPNHAGTLAMARTSDPHSATAQFFINLNHNEMLDRDKCPDGWGYAVFGKVVDGMQVVEEIGAVQTHAASNGMNDVPVEPVVIESIHRVDLE
ncbi:MAG: peptidylprolyl isomerase [bacterium]